MGDKLWLRLGGVAGIVYVVASVAGKWPASLKGCPIRRSFGHCTT
jgi:hypothetical protein